MLEIRMLRTILARFQVGMRNAYWELEERPLLLESGKELGGTVPSSSVEG